MKRACFSVFLAAIMATGSLAFCQTAAIEGCSLEVQNRERRLLQGLTTEQLLLIGQNAALFEQMPDPGADPQGALQGLLSAPGIRGLRRDDAAFVILAMAGRHLDEDLREIAGAIQVTNEARRLLLAASGKLESSLAAAGPDAAAERKGGQRGAGERALATGSAGAASGAAVTGPAAGLLRTTHYKIEYWRSAPLVMKELSGMSRQEKTAEAALLKAKLAELDGLLAAMSERAERAKLRRQQLAQSLEGMAQKTPRALEQQ